MSSNLENPAAATRLEKINFHSNLKEGQCQRMFKVPYSCTHFTWCALHRYYNKQDNNIQPWHTPFPIWNQSIVMCFVLAIACLPAYRFLKRQVRWSGIPISFRIFQFVVIHTVKGFGIVNKAEIDVFWNSLVFWWSSRCWQFDLWFLCLF